MENKSGIYPCGNRVLVFVDQIEEKMKDSMIELLPDTIEAQQSSNASGVLVEAGPDAFLNVTYRTYRLNGSRKELFEERVSGTSYTLSE